mgnify:CR=1 FL=1
MDAEGNDLWDAKREQHRDLRKRLYEQCLGELNANGILTSGSAAERLYDVATQYNGELILQWRQYFNDYWRRAAPVAATEEAEKGSQDVQAIIDEEETGIDKEIQELLKQKNIAFTEPNLAPGKARLHNSCEVLRKKCAAEIKTLRRIREAELRKERELRKDTVIASAISLVVGILIAVVSVWLTDWANRTHQSAIERRQERATLRDEKMRAVFGLAGLIERLESLHSARGQYQISAQVHKKNYDILKKDFELFLYFDATANANRAAEQILPVRQQVLEVAQKVEMLFALSEAMKKRLQTIKDFRTFDAGVVVEFKSEGYSQDAIAGFLYEANQKTLAEGKRRIDAALQNGLSGPGRELLVELRSQIDR